MKDVKEKRCPFRVCKVERPQMLRGNGTTWTEEFCFCMGEECAAYYPGGCLRLQPPAYTMRANLTGQELQVLRNDLLRGGQIMPYNPEQESAELIPRLYEGEAIFVDWHERLSQLEYVYNPGNDGPWYRADDVWACIDPVRSKEVQK